LTETNVDILDDLDLTETNFDILNVFSSPAHTDVFSSPAHTDIFSSPAHTDVFSSPAHTDIFSSPVHTDVFTESYASSFNASMNNTRNVEILLEEIENITQLIAGLSINDC
jgi:hypothetical protein